MVEQKAKKKEQESGKRMAKWIWYVAIAILIVAIGCYCLSKAGLLDFQTVDQQLAAIEAAHAIPDEENAAIIYYQLMQDYDKRLLWPDCMYQDDDLASLTWREPWLSKDYPELAQWLKDQQDIISTLLQASKIEKCRFRIITDSQQINVDMRLLNAMREWTRLLILAVNNDVAEGRIDAGIQKCNCLIQMGKHLCQQPVLINYLVGLPVEAVALNGMKTIILQGEPTENHLKIIEAAMLSTENNWNKDSAKILEVERLYEKKQSGFFYRLKRLWRALSEEDTFNRIHTIYLRQIAIRRGSRILIALRRYKNTNGRWPETLDGIKDLVPEEILVDSINGGSFVYKLTEENFTFYSKGENNIDDGGEYSNKSGADDWPIWPTSSRKTKNEKADTAKSNTQKDEVK
jgi:hypothetical protein